MNVSLLGIKQLSNRNSGNILVVKNRFISEPAIQVRWKDRDTLQVIRASTMQVLRAVVVWEGIRVEYVDPSDFSRNVDSLVEPPDA